jgi:hypothetical protein
MAARHAVLDAAVALHNINKMLGPANTESPATAVSSKSKSPKIEKFRQHRAAREI